MAFLLTSLLSFSICCFFTIDLYNRDSDQLALEELEHSSNHIADLIKLIDDKNQDKILADYSETSEMSFTVTCEGQTKSYGHVNKKLILKDDELKTLATSKEKSLRSEGIISQYAKAFKIDNQTYVITVQKDFLLQKDIFMKSYTSAAIIFMMTGSIVFLIVADIIVKPISRLTKVTDELAKGIIRCVSIMKERMKYPHCMLSSIKWQSDSLSRKQSDNNLYRMYLMSSRRL